MTDRQRDILAFIVAHFRETLTVPTVREIGAEFDIASPNGVMCHLLALARKGLLAYEPVAQGDPGRRCRGYGLVGLRELLLPGIDAFAASAGLPVPEAAPCPG